MRYFKRVVRPVSAVILITLFSIPGLPQSGRGRPKVPQPTSEPARPAPVINIPAATAVVKQEQFGTTSRFVLRNGITVIINEHHATPLAACVAMFKAGADDEPWSLSHLAKLTQRMVLKGTILRPGDHAISELRALGASVSSSIGYDGAQFSVIAPAEKLKNAVEIQADMVQNSAFDPQTLARETARLVDEEKRFGTKVVTGVSEQSLRAELAGDDPAYAEIDAPADYSMNRACNLAFTGNVAGNTDTSITVSRDQLTEFYKSHYRPENLIVSIAGDVSTFDTLVEVQQVYGDFGIRPTKPAEPNVKPTDQPKTKTPVRAPAQQPTEAQVDTAKTDTQNVTKSALKPWGATQQPKLRYASERGDVTQSIVSMAFHVPGMTSKDWAALEVLSAVVGNGRASALTRSLVDGQMVASWANARYLAFGGTGLITVQVFCPKETRDGASIDKAESALFKELDRLRKTTPAEGDLLRAKSLLEKRFADRASNYRVRAQAFARAEAAERGFHSTLDYRTRIRAVTAEDVQRAAAKYFTLANTSIHEYEPASAPARTFDVDTFATTVNAWVPAFAQPVEASAVRASDAASALAPVAQGAERTPERQLAIESNLPLPVKNFSTLNGPKAFVREDHSQQTVTVAILFQGGRLVEDASNSGTTELMLRSMLCGTPRRLLSQMSQELDQLGAEVQIVVEPDFFGFILSSLSRNGERALKLLRDVIEEPAFREDDIARARLGQIALIRDSRDSGLAHSRDLLLQAMFGTHSYGLPVHGREEVIGALNSEKLGEWYAKAVKRQVPVAIIIGDTDGSALVSAQIAEGFRRRDPDTSIQVRTPTPGTTLEKTDSSKDEMTSLAVGAFGPKAGSPDIASAMLIESAMNGEGGVLFRELRDKQDIIWSGSFKGESMFVAGLLAAYVATSQENEAKSKAALLSEFARMSRGDFQPDEIAASKALAATRGLALLQSQSEHALKYAHTIFYKQEATEVDDIADQLSKVTPEAVKKLAAAAFKTGASYVGAVRGSAQKQTPPVPKQE